MRGIFLMSANLTRGGEVVSRKAHNLEIGGAIPPPATKQNSLLQKELHSLLAVRTLAGRCRSRLIILPA